MWQAAIEHDLTCDSDDLSSELDFIDFESDDDNDTEIFNARYPGMDDTFYGKTLVEGSGNLVLTCDNLPSNNDENSACHVLDFESNNDEKEIVNARPSGEDNIYGKH